MSQNSPFTTTEQFWGYFLAQPHPDFFQKQCHAHGIPFHIVDGKKNSPNLGYGLARPRIFRDLCKKTLTHPHSEFFHCTFLDWKNFTKAFKTLFFCLFIENGSQREERAGTRRSLRLAEQRNRKRTAAGILDEPIPTVFANPVLRPKRYIRVPEIKIRKAEKGNQRTRGDAWIEG